MEWLNEPPEWSEADGTLTVATGDRTDFWRKTHYGFIRDNACALIRPSVCGVSGHVSAT